MLRFAIRNLLKTKVFGLLNVTGLAVGMAAAVFILLWVQNESSFDTYHAKSERTKLIITHNQVNKEETWHWSTTPLLLAKNLQQVPEIEQHTLITKPFYPDLTVKIGDQLTRIEKAACVDENWFSVFDYTVVDGSFTDFNRNIRSIALTESKASQLFGSARAVGQLIRIDTLDYVVRAVMKDNPVNSSFQYDCLVPLAAHLAKPETYKNDYNWNNYNYETYVVLRPDADVKKAEQKITKIIRQDKKDEKTGKPETSITLELEALADIHFDTIDRYGSNVEQGDRRTVYIFLGLALAILLMACINYVNLTTARASIRAKEVGVKKIIGAGSTQLFGQFMLESILMCLVALGVALLLVYGFLPVFNNLTNKTFSLSFGAPSIWLVLGGTALLTVVLTGVYPALLLSSFQPVRAIRGLNILGSSNSVFRKSLVVVQFTISIIFLIATLVVYQQIRFIRTTKLGYDRDHIVALTIPWNAKPKVDPAVFKSRLLEQSSIADATLASQNIVEIKSSHSGSLDWDGRPADFQPTVGQLSVEPTYQKVFNLKMAQGRWFEPDNTADEQNVVLNETAVRKFNLRKPIVGQRFHFQGMKGVLIGVVKDFHFKSLHEAITPLVLFNNPGWRSGVYVKIVPGKEAEALKAIQSIWTDMIPSRPLDYKFLDETFDRLYKTEARTATLFNAFAVIAILISCLGLFGLATFTAEMRIKEIGIRKVLGASVMSLTTLLSKDFLKLVLIALLLAVPVGYYCMNLWLNGFAYKIDMPWWLFALAGLLAIGIALLTISFQSIKAALTNPVKSLRSE
ncbi:ABC transporter permease [Spirosoma sp. BT702]|uniref:ABC transporter permease n=1 Tax=Spirosoma profusum TaxID=2771354 RepID=A0A926XZW7_9BACT|nr:ABC transporter permease [Spirosoma profusum]MBD2699216.1 ABC transporter permease [Spirosoma profusum]